jgi:parvulin-like peptidyl-prolyl isomerase
MLRLTLAILLAASAALAQTKASQQTLSPANATKPAITIHGLCDHAAKAKACTTLVSREDIQAILDVMAATGRTVIPQQRRGVAESYVNLLASAHAATQAGLEKDSRFAEVLRVARLKALSDMYQVHIDEEAAKITPAEIHRAYSNDSASFEELKVRRIAVPMYNSKNLKDNDFAARAKRVAAMIRERAANGEDMDKLEKEAADKLGFKSPPGTSMGPVRRGIFAPEQEKALFALRPGEVTKVMEQPSLFIIFKLESRRTLTEKEATDEIRRKLYSEKLDQLRKSVTASIHADYDDDYFGPTANSAWVPMGDDKK